MYKSNIAENHEKQTAWKCRLDQYPQMILIPEILIIFFLQGIPEKDGHVYLIRLYLDI